jgi:hypothetical protein
LKNKAYPQSCDGTEKFLWVGQRVEFPDGCNDVHNFSNPGLMENKPQPLAEIIPGSLWGKSWQSP